MLRGSFSRPDAGASQRMVKPRGRKPVPTKVDKSDSRKSSRKPEKAPPPRAAKPHAGASGHSSSNAHAHPSHPPHGPNGAAPGPAVPPVALTGKIGGTPELAEKIKELIRLAQEQGYLTYSDINDALPDSIISHEDLDEIYSQLRNLEIEIVDQAEVDRVKQPEPEEEDDKSRLDILDDPVRMYLKQMGQVPLLTREQEVEISKRIEDAENEVKRIIYGFGFSGKEHIALAEKLISEPPKERFDRVIVDKKIEGRENHLKELRKLVKAVRDIDQDVDECYATVLGSSQKSKTEQAIAKFRKIDKKLQDSFPKFYYKQKVIEEMALVAENIHDKIQASLRAIQEWEALRKSAQQQAVISGEQKKIKALEEFV
ncbi:MAG: RNA polymerase subunit sigma, partial [Verrucomicrobia bacterium]|nr:RNA polymerase subunit sigma [Verrucomicrobiota bacterium]